MQKERRLIAGIQRDPHGIRCHSSFIQTSAVRSRQIHKGKRAAILCGTECTGLRSVPAGIYLIIIPCICLQTADIRRIPESAVRLFGRGFRLLRIAHIGMFRNLYPGSFLRFPIPAETCPAVLQSSCHSGDRFVRIGEHLRDRIVFFRHFPFQIKQPAQLHIGLLLLKRCSVRQRPVFRRRCSGGAVDRDLFTGKII